VPGVVKKTAERLLIELKYRLAVADFDVASVIGGNGGAPSAVGDVREALGQLGYSNDEIRETLRELPPGVDAAVMLRDALKLLGARRA
jgi:Holliday junction DNA helicase RuvA